MDDLSTGKEKHILNIRWQKYSRLLGYLKHYLKEPLARKEERPLKVVVRRKMEWEEGHYGMEDDISYGYDVNLRRGEQQTAPNIEVADKEILVPS